ncbi:DUF4290 domain-containing protein [Rubrivirga sp.]|uniref:DUF4290 domain-containing protein n=1 Tax=Rubrivirga sp. TaxID=1885344 RepID=UPI003C731289
MTTDRRILDRQVGRNAQLFAEAAGDLPSPEARFPYVRILVSLIENAHPEWSQAPQKATQIADLLVNLSNQTLDRAEVADVVRVRDEEKGLGSSR